LIEENGAAAAAFDVFFLFPKTKSDVVLRTQPTKKNSMQKELVA